MIKITFIEFIYLAYFICSYLSIERTDGSATGNNLLDSLDFGTMSEEDFQEIRQVLMKLLEKRKQKVIAEAELEDYINDGWRFVDSVGESRAIVER